MIELPPTPAPVQRTIDLGSGRCLRVRVTLTPTGRPEHLWLSEGWHIGGDDRWRMIGPLRAQLLPELLAALDSLNRETEP